MGWESVIPRPRVLLGGKISIRPRVNPRPHLNPFPLLPFPLLGAIMHPLVVNAPEKKKPT